MNRMIPPSCLLNSFNTDFSRSSNSPRNFAPATSKPRSNANSCLPFRLSGASPLTMRCANPSTMAVLPTPGSPIKTGLFFVRLCNTWIVRRISSSRPITGSNFPCRACSVRLIVNLSKAPRLLSPWGSLTLSPPRTFSNAAAILRLSAPLLRNSSPNPDLSAVAARANNSLEMYWSLRSCACLSHRLSNLSRSLEM